MQKKRSKLDLSLGTFYTLRREPLYHKLQYSKVPKFDVAAAILGVIVGAFVVYLSLCTVGSAGADLTDLTTLVWYILVWANILYFFSLKLRASSHANRAQSVIFVCLKEMALSTFFYLSTAISAIKLKHRS